METHFNRTEGLTIEKSLTAMEVGDVQHFKYADATNNSVNTACSTISRLSGRSYRARKIEGLQETLVIRES